MIKRVEPSISMSSWKCKKMTLKEIEDALRKRIEEKLGQELRYGFQLSGPQKMIFIFLNSYEAKSTASSREKNQYFSLKLSEVDMVLREKKESPILIIDDISSYFDSNRRIVY